MVEYKEICGKTHYMREICRMAFTKKNRAEHCEENCKEGKPCLGKMIRHSIKI